MLRGRMLPLLLLIVVIARAQESQEVAEAPAVEVLSDELVGDVLGGNSLLGNGDVNATAADAGNRRRLMASKKKINEDMRARRALQASKAARMTSPGAPLTDAAGAISKTTPFKRSSTRRTLLQKPRTGESAAVSNILSKLQYEEQQGFAPRSSGANLAI